MESKKKMKYLVCPCLLGRLTPKLSRAAKRISLNALLDIIAEHLGDLAFHEVNKFFQLICAQDRAIFLLPKISLSNFKQDRLMLGR